MTGYRPQLDGLRALAVLAVAWSHWERPYQFGIPFGAGVHLFYVLSGLLITGILLDVRDATDRATALKAFCIRRVLRIFPAFYLTLALAWWADVPYVRQSLPWHAAYLSNVFTVRLGAWPGAISPLWSLAVEEQFYLLWPWLIVLTPRHWLLPSVIGAIALAPICRWWMAAQGYPESMHALLTPGCFDSLGVGAVLALLQRRRTSADATERMAIPGVTALACAAVLVALIALQAAGVAVGAVVTASKQTLQAIVFGWIVLRASAGFAGIAGRILTPAPLIYIGRISYGIYLAHGFAGALAGGLFAMAGIAWPIAEPWRYIVLLVVTIGAATVSWHLLEAPVNGLKRFFPYVRDQRRRTRHRDAEAQRKLLEENSLLEEDSLCLGGSVASSVTAQPLNIPAPARRESVTARSARIV